MTDSTVVEDTTTLEVLPSSVHEIADLARRDAERVPIAYELDSDRSLVVVKLRNDEHLKQLDLERHLEMPRRARGNADVHDPTDFAQYVNRLADSYTTTVWADVTTGVITAVINDHWSTVGGGWRDHTIRLRLQPDEDWERWHQLNGRRISQLDFAEFIEGLTHTIIAPDAATMLEVATTMSAKRSVDFAQGTRLSTGDVQLTCVETTTAAAGAKSHLDVPERIRIRIAPWLGVPPVDLDARLTYRIANQQLAIGYQILRSDIARRDAFSQMVAQVQEALTEGLPVYLGAPPNPTPAT